MMYFDVHVFREQTGRQNTRLRTCSTWIYYIREGCFHWLFLFPNILTPHFRLKWLECVCGVTAGTWHVELEGSSLVEKSGNVDD